jgi:hypothetical protein
VRDGAASLFYADAAVVVAVSHQEGRRAGVCETAQVSPIDRVWPAGGRESEETSQGAVGTLHHFDDVIGCILIVFEKIGGSVVLHDGGQSAGHFRMWSDPAHQIAAVAGECNGTDQVGACAGTEAHDAVGIKSVVVGIGPHPAHGGGDIVDGSGEDGLATEPVLDRGDRKPCIKQKSPWPHLLDACEESSRVCVQHHGNGCCCRTVRDVQIQREWPESEEGGIRERSSWLATPGKTSTDARLANSGRIMISIISSGMSTGPPEASSVSQ